MAILIREKTTVIDNISGEKVDHDFCGDFLLLHLLFSIDFRAKLLVCDNFASPSNTDR